MLQIKIDFVQLILLIVFIYIFTYYWLPRPQDNNIDEYLKLLEKYNKVLNDRKFYKSEYLKAVNVQSASIGKSINSHSGPLKPSSLHRSDNNAVTEFIN